ncbi:hypothetical protein B7P43_G08853 [Cryptotermes secundus]|uniref:Armadillo repeat-containing protein 2 n=3 Tax=Cryptotermes secundus TaxID=105785 RepID=A0A2J7RJD9_9NEOP|nr:hypothetical protein B7P43_G08853 [Cryptotermes secundus]
MIPSFLTPDQISNAANKFRLPSIDGRCKPLLSKRHQFRASASLDNLPEEIEIDDSESQDCGLNSGSTKDVPPARKAYSSPVQRTKSMDTELEQCASTSSVKLLGAQPFAEINSGINEGAQKLLKVAQNKINEETDTVKVVASRNTASCGVLKDGRNQHTVCEENIQKDPSHSLKAMKGNSLESKQRSPSKVKMPLQPSLGLATCAEKSTLSSMKLAGSKKKNSYTADQNKRNKLTAGKENSSQDPPTRGNAFGPELNITTLKNKHLPDTSQNNSQGQKEKSTSIMMVKNSKPVSKNDTGLKQSSLTVDPVINGKWATISQSEVALECGTESKLQNLAVAQPQPSRETSTLDSAAELKNKQALYHAKQATETAEKHVSVRKKSKSEDKNVVSAAEEKSSFVLSILSVLNSLAGKEECTEEAISCMSKLYSALEAEGGIGRNIQNTKLRAQVLKTLYKFVESSNEMLLLQIARIILAFRVSGKNLSGVCKLVFKVSRCDKNDRLFLEDNILELFVEVLGSASPLEDAESCVYGYGALKFLTMNNVLLAKVLKLGILELMVLHMKMVNTARLEGSRIPEQTSHALFQLTGALRNVAGEEEVFPQFVSTGAVNELCRAMDVFSSDLDVISNISRTLSIISTHDDCCMSIVSYGNIFKIFVRLLQKYPGRQDIVVRLGYALGNLMASSDIARTKFFNEDGAVASMLNLLSIYLDKDLQMLGSTDSHSELNSDAGSSGSVEDVMVKMVRILANMSINPMVGSSLTCTSPVFCSNYVQQIEVDPSNVGNTTEGNKDGRQFLDVLLTVLRHKSVVDSEELVHSTLSTLNNLSYYPISNDGAFGERQLEIAQALCSLLHTDNKECLVETTRVYGNLTRSKDIRDFLVESGAWNQILKFLDWDDQELLCTTVGILVNMMADWDKRLALKEGHGIERLTRVLKKFGEGDWQLATMICQVIWNYCIESVNLHAALGIDQTNQLLGILVDFLDEERLFGVVEGTDVNEALATSEYYQMWEEFAGVATNLLEKMETFLDSLDSPEQLEHMEPLLSDHQSLGHSISSAQPELQQYQVL